MEFIGILIVIALGFCFMAIGDIAVFLKQIVEILNRKQPPAGGPQR